MFSRSFDYGLDEDDEDLDEFDEFDEDEDDDAEDYYERLYEEEADGESALEVLARLAADIEAGEYAGWQLDRSHPGILVWTTPAGRRYASTLTGEQVPLP